MRLHDAWIAQLERLLRHGHHVVPRGQETLEERAVQLVVDDWSECVLLSPTRKLNYRFMVAEFIWMALGRRDVAGVARYNSQIAQFSDDGRTFAGAYGPRVDRQWGYVVNTLRQDPASRQAIISIWEPNPGRSRDIPCTLSLQFLIRDRRLEVIATMRSSDIWLGVPYDVFNFSMLANALAGELNDLEPGPLILNLGSSHLYLRNVAAAQEVLARRDVDVARAPRLPGRPPLYMNWVLDNPRDPGAWRVLTEASVHPAWIQLAGALAATTSAEAREILSQKE